jgi:hypothetical protein
MQQSVDATENRNTVLFIEDSSEMPPAVGLACARLRLHVAHLRKVESRADKKLFVNRPLLILGVSLNAYQWVFDYQIFFARVCPNAPRFIFSYQKFPGSVVVDFISKGFKRLPPGPTPDQIHEVLETAISSNLRAMRRGVALHIEDNLGTVSFAIETDSKSWNPGSGEVSKIWISLLKSAGQVCTLEELATAANCSLKEVHSYVGRLRFRYERSRRSFGLSIDSKTFIQTKSNGYLLHAEIKKDGD